MNHEASCDLLHQEGTRRLWISPAISASAHHVVNSCGRSGTLVTQLEQSWSRFGPVLEDVYTASPHSAHDTRLTRIYVCEDNRSNIFRTRTVNDSCRLLIPTLLSTLSTRVPHEGWGSDESEWLAAHRIITFLFLIIHTVDNFGPGSGEHLPPNRCKLISRGML